MRFSHLSLNLLTAFISANPLSGVKYDKAMHLQMLELLKHDGDNPTRTTTLAARQTAAAPCPDPLNMPWATDTYTCPHKVSIDSSGACTDGLALDIWGERCTGYCEVRNSWCPGPEVVFEDSSCQQGDSCTLATAKVRRPSGSAAIRPVRDATPTVATDTHAGQRLLEYIGINAGNVPDPATDDLTAAVTFGASFEWTISVTYTPTETHSHSSNQTASHCGYVNFVPYYLASCGSLTVGAPGGEPPSPRTCVTDDSQLTTTGNWCNSNPATDSSGNGMGAVVFVLTDCDGGGLLDMADQMPIYQYPGVSQGTAAVSQASKNRRALTAALME